MARPISKGALIKYLAEEAGSSQKVAGEFLDTLTKVVTRRLINGDAVTPARSGKV